MREGGSALTSLTRALEGLAFSLKNILVIQYQRNNGSKVISSKDYEIFTNLYSWLTEGLTEHQKLVVLGHLH